MRWEKHRQGAKGTETGRVEDEEKETEKRKNMGQKSACRLRCNCTLSPPTTLAMHVLKLKVQVNQACSAAGSRGGRERM